MSQSPTTNTVASLRSPTPRVAFTSHKILDYGYAAELESLLRALVHGQVFNDVHAIRPDEKLWPAIEQGTGGCDVFYVVITSRPLD